MKRPVVWAMFFLCAGVAAGLWMASGQPPAYSQLPASGWVMILSAALSAAAIGAIYRWPPAAVFFICFVLGLLRVNQSLYTDPVVSQWSRDGDDLRVAGYALETAWTKTGRERIVLDAYLIERDGERRESRMRILAVMPEGRQVEIGDGIVLRGEFLPLDEARNPGAFNEFLYYRAKKIHYKCFPEIEKISGGGTSLKPTIFKWRDRLAGVYRSVLPGEEAAVVTSVVLGDKSGLG
ncbi:MAG: DUF4131 domain-containing protein, partial [Clostridiales bacterium]|nr:DUF4131 domain-containing protein [Clostridiales bacterium]